MSDSPLWITEADVTALLDMPGAIRALSDGLRAEARGVAANMTKTHVEWGDHATLHAIGAAFPEAGVVGTKTWAHTPGGATPLLVLFDSQNGSLQAIIEAFALGQFRTGAASGVATAALADPGADELAIIGTGKQAITQVAAVAAVRALRLVRIFGRDAERREQFAARVREELGLETVAALSVAEAVRGAGIVTAVTRAREPFLTAAILDRGTHVNAVGAIVPSGAEVASDVLARCSQVVVDSVSQAQRLSSELIGYFGSTPSGWDRVAPLSRIVKDGTRRSTGDDLTLFKALGMGISDLALGIDVYRQAGARGMGRAFAHPRKAAPRLRP